MWVMGKAMWVTGQGIVGDGQDKVVWATGQGSMGEGKGNCPGKVA